MIGYADAMALAEQGGLDVEQMLEVVASGMGSSRALKELAPKSLEGDFQPGFLAEHFRKDIALALAQSEDLEITLPGAETAFTILPYGISSNSSKFCFVNSRLYLINTPPFS